MTNVIIAAVILLMAGLASFYIVRKKRKAPNVLAALPEDIAAVAMREILSVAAEEIVRINKRG